MENTSVFTPSDTHVCHDLWNDLKLYSAQLPDELIYDTQQFVELWKLHPDVYHEIIIHGRPVFTPRFQQSFGVDYHCTGNINKALPVHPLLQPLLGWCQDTIDDRLNGILVNWYDGNLKHYIGAHRDSTKNMIPNAPIVTLSFGEERIFRIRPWKEKGFIDFPASNGSLFIMPYETNLSCTHEVPHFACCKGWRISVTLRAFEETADVTAL